MAAAREKICGILGGMGPEATVDLMQRIIRLTPALDDADHIRCIVDNNPKVPSRIRALIEKNNATDREDPGPCLAGMARNLESAGADFLVVACNTAHHYYPSIQAAVQIPVIHLIGLAARRAVEQFPGILSMGILGSPAVRDTGLYTAAFAPYGLKEIWPEKAFQDRLFQVIRQVKKGDTGADTMAEFTVVCNHLKDRGGSPALIACTELSILNSLHPGLAIAHLDAAELLAAQIIEVARNRLPADTFAPTS